MEILIKITRISSRNNKYQRGDSFRKYQRRGKKISPRTVWFSASGKVEIINVRWPFITWWSKEVQVYWWIKLQHLRAFKCKDNKPVLFWCYIKNKFIIHHDFFDANNIFSHLFIQNLKHKPNMVQDLSRKIIYHLKNRDIRTVLNNKYTK